MSEIIPLALMALMASLAFVMLGWGFGYRRGLRAGCRVNDDALAIVYGKNWKERLVKHDHICGGHHHVCTEGLASDDGCSECDAIRGAS